MFVKFQAFECQCLVSVKACQWKHTSWVVNNGYVHLQCVCVRARKLVCHPMHIWLSAIPMFSFTLKQEDSVSIPNKLSTLWTPIMCAGGKTVVFVTPSLCTIVGWRMTLGGMSSSCFSQYLPTCMLTPDPTDTHFCHKTVGTSST